ncbi:hypothetical protein MBLNU459_g3075t1 [Dothideomycetes sp. NU459]
MPDTFKNKVILITGAGSGIGRATAVRLHSLGATVALTDINPSSLQSTVDMCKLASGDLHGRFDDFDIGDTAACDAFVAETARRLGRIDHVFNCAGINPTAYELQDAPDGYFDRLVSANLKGVYNMTRACIQHMRRGGSFVNVSSVLGLHPARHMAIYCATKYAVVGFSKAMALELGPKGVRVNVVAPGYIDTPTNASVVAGEQSVKDDEAKIAMGRLGTADEIANVVVFLMGDGASYTNGAVIEVNGGTG